MNWHYKTTPVEERVILDLCGGTGSWSQPYRDAGYDVVVVDIEPLDTVDIVTDVRKFVYTGRVHGILAAPPCTHLSASGARWWKEKGDDALLEALSIADACIRIVSVHKPRWWALENPVGRLRNYYGPPRFSFDPCDFGDPYTKRTLLWGAFSIPETSPVAPSEGSKMHLLPPSEDRARIRSTTPPGFARAFFEANP